MRTKLSQFNFELPEKLVAKYPTEYRDESRLMVVHRDTGKIEHKTFKDVINYFDDGDVSYDKSHVSDNDKAILDAYLD